MNTTLEKLTDQILHMPPENRVELVYKVCDSLEHFSDKDIENAWLTEADRRWKEIEEGKVKCIPAVEVMNKARAALKDDN